MLQRTENVYNDSGLFIIPHYASNINDTSKSYIEHTIDGLLKQTDKNWQAIIIDDCSTDNNAIRYLKKTQAELQNKVEVIFLTQNIGPGSVRNLGLLRAFQNNNHFVLFNDADDISHPNRLEHTRELFLSNPDVDLIYSTFKVIDEKNCLRSPDEIPSSIQEIIEFHQQGMLLEGYNVWVDMGIKTGYINKTSSTSIRTKAAIKCPFPDARASEDFNTWMRISAMGAKFKYTADIPTYYRIPSYLNLQNSRAVLGNTNFNKIKIKMDSEGFEHSIDIAISRGEFDVTKIHQIRAQFYIRLAQSMKREGEKELEHDMLKIAENCKRLNDINQRVL